MLLYIIREIIPGLHKIRRACLQSLSPSSIELSGLPESQSSCKINLNVTITVFLAWPFPDKHIVRTYLYSRKELKP